jgi:1-phosphatidylinositol phosphodiesterase
MLAVVLAPRLVSNVRRGTPALALAMLLSLVVAPAALGSAYSSDSAPQREHTDWMSSVPGNLSLAALSIPGTHDSGASEAGGVYALTQSMSIADQLKAGIRAFDIRLGRYASGDCSSGLWVVHGVACQNQTFGDVLEAMTQFLSAHGDETLFMMIGHESGTRPGDQDFASEVHDALRSAPVKTPIKDYIFSRDFCGSPPQLDDVRGHIVLIKNYTDVGSVLLGDHWSFVLPGIVWDCLDRQNRYVGCFFWSLATKWNGSGARCTVDDNTPDASNNVVKQFEKAQWGPPRSEVLPYPRGGTTEVINVNQPRQIFVNFLSASGGPAPYFFASGQRADNVSEVARTNAPLMGTQLWTRGQINTCSGDDYCLGEYPCVGQSVDAPPCTDATCALTCDVAYKGINHLTRQYLHGPTTPTVRRTGIVFADFPGADLIEEIIDRNTRTDYQAPTASPVISPDLPSPAGWHNADVHVFWVWDDEAGVWFDRSDAFGTTPANCPWESVSSGEGDHVVVTATCTDRFGNSYTASKSVKVDKTPPTISAAATTLPNGSDPTGNDWYNHNVTVHFTCTDTLSGINPSFLHDCPDDQVLTDEGAGIASTAKTVKDEVFNESEPSNVVTVNIDKTKPQANPSLPPDSNGSYTGNVTVTWNWSDTAGGSGIDTGNCPERSTSTGVGDAVVVTATCKDYAGNEETASVTVKIEPDGGPVAPRGATPLRVSLVPAFSACAAPNRVHGPPLASDSCAPPQQSSRALTVGTPDANGKRPASLGMVRLATVVGNPATGADEADVSVSASITDVRETAGLGDYTGEVTISLSARITDRDGPATISLLPFNIAAQCAATADSAGGTCIANTTFDALLPGAVTEDARAVWQLDAVEVLDADGDTFMRQGVFVP